MPSGVIISPRMLSILTDFYPSLVTVQERTDAQDSFGQPIPAWANKAGHIGLACVIAPIVLGSPEGAEVKRPDGTITVATHHLGLAGYYSTITAKMRAVVGGVTYDVLSVECDSHGKTTRLRLEVVN